jgi:hypothetical protein
MGPHGELERDGQGKRNISSSYSHILAAFKDFKICAIVLKIESVCEWYLIDLFCLRGMK